jgi:hypothetical protein
MLLAGTKKIASGGESTKESGMGAPRHRDLHLLAFTFLPSTTCNAGKIIVRTVTRQGIIIFATGYIIFTIIPQVP